MSLSTSALRKIFLLLVGFLLLFQSTIKTVKTVEKLHCVSLTFLKLFTWGSEIVLNHQLRNVQKLIMISWHLQNRSVTISLGAELKSFYKLCTAEAIWCRCSLIWIKITIFHCGHEKCLFGIVLSAVQRLVWWWSDGSVCSTDLWDSLLSLSKNQRWFILYCFSLFLCG